ncbi:MAG: M1 family metallopeptidase [Bacteroidota bacterium]
MKSLIVCAVVLSLLSSPLDAQQTIFPKPLSPRIANYSIAVSLDAVKKTLKAKETLVWRNTSNDRISELRFHLYLNAFKNAKSTFMKESGGNARGAEMGKEGWGWINVTSLEVRGGESLTSKMEFIRPDDGNEHDQTVFRVPLSKPVFPNQTVTLDIDFDAQLPTVFARTGYNQDFFMVGQWFPKIGVYELAGMRYAKQGQWNCHQFHANTEFYADYGVYDVAVTVPKNFVVGATGVLQGESENGNGTKTLRYHEEDIHDFSWTASPLYKIVEDKWEHVSIRLLIQPDRIGQAPRYISSAKATLQYFQSWVGTYPYPNLTIVDPQWGGMGSGGMEYPTLITGGTVWGVPEHLRLPELVTVHEFAHNYWYGLVGSNEFEEAWLDEGFTQYSETRIMNETYGAKTSVMDLFGIRIGDFEFTRMGYARMQNPKVAPTYLNAWEYNAGGYGDMTYNKTASFMTTLERMLGRPVMDEIMKTYFERWKFKHPCSRDFIAVVNEIVPKRLGVKFGKDMNWFFDQELYGTDVCDYELSWIENKVAGRDTSVIEKGEKKDSTGKSAGNGRKLMYDGRIVVSRLGEVKMPVDVLVHFDSGKEVRERWDGEARWKDFKYRGTERILWAKVDPDEVLAIDINTINNSKTQVPPTAPVWRYTAKFMFWVQNLLQTAAIF